MIHPPIRIDYYRHPFVGITIEMLIKYKELSVWLEVVKAVCLVRGGKSCLFG